MGGTRLWNWGPAYVDGWYLALDLRARGFEWIARGSGIKGLDGRGFGAGVTCILWNRGLAYLDSWYAVLELGIVGLDGW